MDTVYIHEVTFDYEGATNCSAITAVYEFTTDPLNEAM